MSTSLIYHAFGIRGYVHERSEFVGGEVHFTIAQPAERLRCAVCRSRNVVRRGGRERCFRGLPIGQRRVWIILKVPRLECRACGALRQAEVPFAPGQHGFTKRFARYVLDLSGSMSMWDLARHLGVSWNLVKALLKESLRHRFSRPRLKDLRFIAIDEISIGRNHRYLTVVLDLESGAVVHLGDGKGADALLPFWKRLRRAGAKIEAVALDMSPAYTSAVRAHLPGAILVFDPFHVVKLMNEKLSDLRRELHRKASWEEKPVLKGTRWLLLRAPERLDDEKQERERLGEALKLNAPLAAAYYLKEDLRRFWSLRDKTTATGFLEAWIVRARSTGIRQLRQMADTLSLR